jgi:hypothetical protein
MVLDTDKLYQYSKYHRADESKLSDDPIIRSCQEKMKDIKTPVRILFAGVTGSGKSALINNFYRTLTDTKLSPADTNSDETTQNTKRYYVYEDLLRNQAGNGLFYPILLCDTMGIPDTLGDGAVDSIVPGTKVTYGTVFDYLLKGKWEENSSFEKNNYFTQFHNEYDVDVVVFVTSLLRHPETAILQKLRSVVQDNKKRFVVAITNVDRANAAFHKYQSEREAYDKMSKADKFAEDRVKQDQTVSLLPNNDENWASYYKRRTEEIKKVTDVIFPISNIPLDVKVNSDEVRKSHRAEILALVQETVERGVKSHKDFKKARK